MTRPRLLFAGTPEFARASLAALVDSGARPVAVLTQPDRPAGRGRDLKASPVKEKALQHEIPVYQPLSLKDAQAQQELVEMIDRRHMDNVAAPSFPSRCRYP